MKRLVLLVASLLTAAGCATPTGPSDEEAARAAQAKAALQDAVRSPIAGKLAGN